MRNVKIITFDEFRILVNGENIVKKIGHYSKKAELMQYLVANLNNEMTIDDIASVLWENYDTDDAPDATKLLISRLRADLASYNIADCLLVRKDKCAWVSAKDVEVDFVTMQKCYESTGKVAEEDALCAQYEKIFFIYAGDMLSDIDNAEWIVDKRKQYSEMFASAVKEYAKILKRRQEYVDIARICRLALEKIPLDVDINIIFMKALLKLDKPAEALTQFENISNMYYVYFGGNLPEELVEFYKILMKEEKYSNENIKEIFEELNREDEDEGALMCDYSIFKYIYRLYMRNIKRLETGVFIVLVNVSTLGGDTSPIETDRAMRRLCEIMKADLRVGDALTRKNVKTFALLLPRIDEESSCKFVMERIKQAFYKDVQNTKFIIDYKMMKLDSEEVL